MNPTQQPVHNRYLLPVVMLIGLVIITALFIMKGGAIDQGASIFTAITNTKPAALNGGSIAISPSCRLTAGPNGTVIAPAPSVKVVSPNGGELFVPGQQITVTWTKCNFSSQVSIALGYYPAGSVNYTHAQNILSSGTGLTANDGSEVVTLPSASNLTANGSQFGAFYKVIVFNGGSPQTATVKDVSDNVFSINLPVMINDVSVNVVGSPTLTLVQANPGVGAGDEDVYLAKIRFNITAEDEDLYISKNMANIGYARLGHGTVDAIVLESADSSLDDYTVNSFLIQAGNTEQFTLSFFVRGNDEIEKFMFNSFKYGLADGAGSDDYTFINNPVLQTPSVYLAK